METTPAVTVNVGPTRRGQPMGLPRFKRTLRLKTTSGEFRDRPEFSEFGPVPKFSSLTKSGCHPPCSGEPLVSRTFG